MQCDAAGACTEVEDTERAGEEGCVGDKLREEVGREVLGFWAEVGPIWLVGAIGLGGGDGVPWDQHVPAAEDLETAEGLGAEDILKGFAAPAPLTELNEVSRGLFHGVFAQPA